VPVKCTYVTSYDVMWEYVTCLKFLITNCEKYLQKFQSTYLYLYIYEGVSVPRKIHFCIPFFVPFSLEENVTM